MLRVLRRPAFLLAELIRRDISLRYAGSIGGAAWALVNPLVLCAIYTVVFSKILKIPTPEGFQGSAAAMAARNAGVPRFEV